MYFMAAAMHGTSQPSPALSAGPDCHGRPVRGRPTGAAGGEPPLAHRALRRDLRRLRAGTHRRATVCGVQPRSLRRNHPGRRRRLPSRVPAGLCPGPGTSARCARTSTCVTRACVRWWRRASRWPRRRRPSLHRHATLPAARASGSASCTAGTCRSAGQLCRRRCPACTPATSLKRWWTAQNELWCSPCRMQWHTKQR